MAMSDSALVTPPVKKRRRAASKEGTAKKMRPRSKQPTDKDVSEACNVRFCSGEEFQKALKSISAADWKRVANYKYAAISVDKQAILANGDDSLELADVARQLDERYVVVANPYYKPPKTDGKRQSVA